MHQKNAVEQRRNANASQDTTIAWQDLDFDQNQPAGITRTQSIAAAAKMRPESGNLMKRNLQKVTMSNRASNNRINKSIDVSHAKAILANIQQRPAQFSPLEVINTNFSGLPREMAA